MRKAQKDPQMWLTKQAMKIMNDLRIREFFLYMPGSLEIYHIFAEDIRKKLYEMSAATRGEIADLAEKHRFVRANGEIVFLDIGDRFPDLANGKGLVTQIAVEAIVGRVFKLLKEEQARREHDSVQEQHDLTGRGSIGHKDLGTYTPVRSFSKG